MEGCTRPKAKTVAFEGPLSTTILRAKALSIKGFTLDTLADLWFALNI